jgi:hypothetical protein
METGGFAVDSPGVFAPELPKRRLATPAALKISAILLAVTSVALALVGLRAAQLRQRAEDGVTSAAAPTLTGAGDLYVALADAEAAASTAFLRAAAEPPALRNRYLDDVDTASEHLVELAARPGLSDEARASIATIAKELPVYTGLIETARSNNRQDFSVGATYLKESSALMRDEILPAATRLYEDGARDLYARYADGTSSSQPVAVLVAAALVLAVLLAAQLVLIRRSRRLLNVGLAVATLVLLATTVWAASAFNAQRQAMLRSQRHGSDQLLVLSTARILALRSLNDENLDLSARGTEPIHMQDFEAVTQRLRGADGAGGLFATSREIASRVGDEHRIDDLSALHDRFLDAHQGVRDLVEVDAAEAVKVAVNDEADAAQALDAGFATEIGRARDALDAGADDARHAARPVGLALAILAVVVAGCALWGLDRRLREYR